ncbi:MAG: sodium-translocating pyrophosphatase [Phycisphaerae bacterium]|nr:sodium-translocating pyrophosphatase [Phycisphaerae bacterium]
MEALSAVWTRGRSVILLSLVVGVMGVGASVAAAGSAGSGVLGATAVVGDVVGIPWLWWIAPGGAILALIFAYVFFRQVKAADPGDRKMQEIAQHVTDGAYAYLRRQYKVVAVFFAVVCVALYFMGRAGLQHQIGFVVFLAGGFFSGLCGFWGMKTATLASNRTTQGAKEGLNRGLTVAFRAGAVMGLVVVGFGLLNITVWFLVFTKFAPWFYGMMGWAPFKMSLVEVTAVMLTFGMGASSQALFARVGGGIFTKAADVGADLVGKVEAGIPEDDPRNPATIADNVGDNVGDVAGMGADLYESYCNSILATAALGVAAAMSLDMDMGRQVRLLAVPMALAGVGTVLSTLGIYLVRTREGASMKQLMGALERGVNGSSLLIVAAAWAVCYLLLGDVQGVSYLGVWGAIVSGLVAGVIIGKGAEHFTSYDFKPTRGIARSSETGPATVIIEGLAEGMTSTWVSLLTVIVAILAAYAFAGGFGDAGVSMGLYGVGIAAVGMLSNLGISLATDAYGPIADNAGGNAEMTGQGPEVRKRTDALDSLGNTTAAMGKGFAIGSAALTALALLAAYVGQIRVGQNRQAMAAVIRRLPEAATEPKAGVGQLLYMGHRKFAIKTREGTDKEAYSALLAVSRVPGDLKAGGFLTSHAAAWAPGGGGARTMGTAPGVDSPRRDNVRVFEYADTEGKRFKINMVFARKASPRQMMVFYDVTLMNPKVLAGMFAGVMLVFVFSAMTMKAVGRAANAMVKEVRRQFREIAGIMEGTGKPDYARCVAISTAGAQKEMIVPSMLALIVPIAVGLVLGVGGVLGLLAGGLTCGFAMAVFMANAGGAWDNAKKYIEAGHVGGKGGDNHKAAVVGDTVGDPFKDTSGPSLNILIKLMSMVSVVFAGLIVKYAPQIGDLLGMK